VKDFRWASVLDEMYWMISVAVIEGVGVFGLLFFNGGLLRMM
jgi:hypothetical protein